jgi:hypothetical protein
MDPGDPDAIAFAKVRHGVSHLRDVADDLVPRNDRVAWRSEPTFDDVEVGSADGTHRYANDHVATARRWRGDVSKLERR